MSGHGGLGNGSRPRILWNVGIGLGEPETLLSIFLKIHNMIKILFNTIMI